MKLMPKTTKYNPDKFRAEVARLNPGDIADVATNWKGKYHAVKNEMVEGTQKAIEIGITGGTAAVMGYLVGRDRARKAELIKAAKQGDYKDQLTAIEAMDLSDDEILEAIDQDDPSKLMGIPKTLIATVVLGAAAIFNAGGKKYNTFVQSAAVGSMATWAAETAMNIGFDRTAKAAEDEAANGNGNGNGNGNANAA